jgi:hypothetical protein
MLLQTKQIAVAISPTIFFGMMYYRQILAVQAEKESLRNHKNNPWSNKLFAELDKVEENLRASQIN